jgi:hypothetical protein
MQVIKETCYTAAVTYILYLSGCPDGLHYQVTASDSLYNSQRHGQERRFIMLGHPIYLLVLLLHHLFSTLISLLLAYYDFSHRTGENTLLLN